MSFLKNIFGTSETEKSTSKLPWNHLEDLGQLNEIVEVSESRPVLIFKHSTTCSISRMAFKNFENEFAVQFLAKKRSQDQVAYLAGLRSAGKQPRM